MERFASVIFLSALASFTSSDIPFRNASLPWQVRVDDVVGRLTIQEIQAQLASGQGATPPISRLGIGEYSWWTNCGRGDVGQNATAFPQAIGIGASFDKDLIYRVAEASSTEVRAYYNHFVKTGSMGIHQALSCWNPNMDLYRDPRWGRGPETLSEDPHHAGEMGYQHVKGLHGTHPRYVRTASACKHFDVSAGPEDWPVSRHDFDAKVSERDWRSYFLPPFRKCAEAGSFGLHCAYNLINGVPACANKKLLTDILRGEWNFTGYVASDAGALLTSINVQHYFNNTVDAAAGCLNAGCGLEVQEGDTRVYNSIIDAMHQNKVTETLVRENMKRLLYTRLRLGEFDPREMNPYNNLDIDDVVLSSTHRQLAVETAVKTFVLLKNTNTFLPITALYSHVAVVGPLANDSKQVFGDYAPNPDPRYISSPLSGLVRLGTTATHAAGCSSTYCTDYRKGDVVKALQGADVVFVCLGTGPAIEAEGHDRHNISLPGQQLQLLQDVVSNSETSPTFPTSHTPSRTVDTIAEGVVVGTGTTDMYPRTRGGISAPTSGSAYVHFNVYLSMVLTRTVIWTNINPDPLTLSRICSGNRSDKPVVLLLFNGGPVQIGWAVANPRVVAILECFYPAQAAGDAIFASLTNTGLAQFPQPDFPTHGRAIPPMVNYSMAGRTYWYFDGEPAFPYGYGLSYTTFRYDDFTCDITVIAGEGLWCSVTVYNTGPYDADEVSQVYMSWQNTSLPVPRIQLVGFTRRFIISSGSVVYEFTVDPRSMAVWTDNDEWVVLPGMMDIYIGGQQPNQRMSVGSNVLQRQFQVIGTKILGKY